MAVGALIERGVLTAAWLDKIAAAAPILLLAALVFDQLLLFQVLLQLHLCRGNVC